MAAPTGPITPDNDAAEWLISDLAARESIGRGKWKAPQLTAFHKRAVGLLARGMGVGIYNVPANWEKAEFHPQYLRVVIRCHGWASFDFSELTRLVIAAHEECIRVQLEPQARNYMAVFLSERAHEAESMFARHPTIEQAVEAYRTGGRA